jgi:hypothetical protein
VVGDARRPVHERGVNAVLITLLEAQHGVLHDAGRWTNTAWSAPRRLVRADVEQAVRRAPARQPGSSGTNPTMPTIVPAVPPTTAKPITSRATPRTSRTTRSQFRFVDDDGCSRRSDRGCDVSPYRRTRAVEDTGSAALVMLQRRRVDWREPRPRRAGRRCARPSLSVRRRGARRRDHPDR